MKMWREKGEEGHEEEVHEAGSRDTSPEPGNALSHWNLEETREDSLLEPSEGA